METVNEELTVAEHIVSFADSAKLNRCFRRRIFGRMILQGKRPETAPQHMHYFRRWRSLDGAQFHAHTPFTACHDIPLLYIYVLG